MRYVRFFLKPLYPISDFLAAYLTGKVNFTPKLLYLRFKFGSNKEVNLVLKLGIMRIPIKTWIQVIPQLIARIDMPERNVRELIHQVRNTIIKNNHQLQLNVEVINEMF